jgi:terminase large subunit-like protein
MAPSSAMRVDKATLFADLGYQPHPAQREIHISLAPRRIVACGVRFGKSLCAAMEGLSAALQPAEMSKGWVIAPTYELSERVFNQLVLVAASHLRHRIVTLKEYERFLVLRNLGGGLSEIRGKSADNPISLLGEGLDWLVVDEASRLKPSIWQSHLSQRLIDRKGWALLISTPKGKGYFYELFRRGQGNDPEFKSWNYPSWSNPLLDKEAIERERARLPERVFRQEYGAEFLEGSGSVFRNVRECAKADWQRDPYVRERYYAGLDLAKIEDYTVLVIVDRDLRVQFVDRFNRVDWDLQVKRIEAACTKFNKAQLWVDTTGKGEPVYEALCHARLRVEPFLFTSKSKNDLITNLSMLLEAKRVTLPKVELWPEGIDELEAFEYSVTDQGNVRTSAPSGIHDDCVIALALAAWGATRPQHKMVCSGGYV